jgi:hypothetical protein
MGHVWKLQDPTLFTATVRAWVTIGRCQNSDAALKGGSIPNENILTVPERPILKQRL